MPEKELPPVIFLAGTSDRAIVACIRSLEQFGVPYRICLPADGSSVRWSLTGYRDRILDDRYESLDDIEAFKQSLTEASTDFSQVVLFPESEEMARTLARQKDWLKENDVLFPCPSFETYAKVADKEPLMELAKRHDIEIPSRLDGEPSFKDIPFVAKPKKNVVDGRELVVYLIHSEDIWNHFQADEDPEDYFYQKFVDGTSLYFCALFENGRVVQHISQKTILQQPDGGSVVKARPGDFFPQSLVEKIENLMADVEWSGVAMFEFREMAGNYYLIEVNPRFWGPLQLCTDNDVHLPVLLYQQAIKEEFGERLLTERNDEFGYFRVNAYTRGFWKQLVGGGYIERNVDQSDGDYKYRDVWLRRDTALVFFFLNVDALFRPLSVALRSPGKALDYARKKMNDIRP